MKTIDDNIYFLFLFLCIFAGFLLGCLMGTKSEQSEAVKAGVAHYVADESGNSKFEYIKK